MALTDNPMSLVVTGNVTDGKKYWLSLWGYEYAYDIWYVGVTPNKSYTLKLSTDSETGAESGSVTISYSQSINNQTPKVTDY